MGSKSSSSNSSSQTAQIDNRVVAGERATVLGSGATLAQDLSTQLENVGNTADSRSWQTSTALENVGNTADSRSWQTSVDSHDTVTLSDAGAMETAQSLARMQSELLKTISGNQTDATKVIAGLGSETVMGMGEALTDMFSTGANWNAKTWGETLAASREILGMAASQAKGAQDTAAAVARDAIAAFEPTQNKESDSSWKTWAAVAAALAIGYKVLT
jgi:hypothetical protein